MSDPGALQGWIGLWLFSPVLIGMIWTDVSQLRIPNAFSKIGLGLFLLSAPLLGPEETVTRISIAVLCFAICFAAFALRLLGGGDAKILPVVMLFVPGGLIQFYLLLFAAALAVGLLLIQGSRLLFGRSGPRLAALQTQRDFPMGVSIGLSGLALAAVPLLERVAQV
ncbi:MAG: prepilin peptidase [Pseudodonghicola sp.]